MFNSEANEEMLLKNTQNNSLRLLLTKVLKQGQINHQHILQKITFVLQIINLINKYFIQ